MKNEIVIVGTEPPCPRCDYLTRMVRDLVDEMGLDVPVRHIDYTSSEAGRIAAESGLVPGTAKDVAKKISTGINWEQVYALMEDTSQSANESSCCAAAGQKWSPELDEALRPCEKMAVEAGIMMTPVLVVGGKKMHQGCVPDRAKVAEWIEAAFGASPGFVENQDVVEVLGVGCEKCDALYERVSSVLREKGLSGRVALKKRSDIGYFAQKGVAMTPGLVVNGQVVSTGRVPDAEQIYHDLGKHLNLGEKPGHTQAIC